MSKHQPAPVPLTNFTETFVGTALDPKLWLISDWGAPGGGTFSPKNVDLSTGMLRLTLTQSSRKNSIGGEISSLPYFGFGTYEWNARVGTTSPTPNGAGTAVSGSVSGMFNFVNDSQTEIDFETLGDQPSKLFLTNWNKPQAQGISQQESNVALPGLLDTFHKYRFVWSATSVAYYVDDLLIDTHTTKIPQVPAQAFTNLWGTNDTGWGGKASIGVTRYMFVRSFSFKA